jgi:hypothetical protein
MTATPFVGTTDFAAAKDMKSTDFNIGDKLKNLAGEVDCAGHFRRSDHTCFATTITM